GDAADGSVEMFEQFAGDARGDFGAVTPRHGVFMSNYNARGFLDRHSDRVPIVRTYGAQIYDFDANPLLLGLPGSDERTLNEGAVGDDGKIGSFAHDFRFAKRNHEIVWRIRRFIISLAIEMFMFEKHHGIIAA